MKNKPKINLIKIDVEGAEDIVFQGAKETLKKCSPIVVGEYIEGNKEYSKLLKKYDIESFLFDENDNIVKNGNN